MTTQPTSTIILGPYLGNGEDCFGSSIRLGRIVLNCDHHTNEQQQVIHSEQNSVVKCVNKTHASDTQVRQIQNEIDILSQCSALPAITHMQFHFQTESNLYLGIDYCSGGDIHTLITSQGITRNDAYFYISQIALGLAQLHHESVVHHDLRPENIFIDENGVLRLGNFANAAILDDSMYNPASQRCEIVSSAGTIEYSAPEIFWRLAHSYEADWWSFGVLAYELLCGELPFHLEGASSQEKCEYVCSIDSSFHRNDEISWNSVEESFMSLFLQKNPKTRFGYYSIDLNVIFDHEFFTVME